jgi:hypothetical protein
MKEIRFKNNDERLKFLNAYEKWPVWLKMPKLRLEVHRATLSDGSIILAYSYPAHYSYGGNVKDSGKSKSFRLFKGKDAESLVAFSSYFDNEGCIIDHIRTNRLFAFPGKEVA